MSDLVKRLRIKAGMIEMGEMIAWGSDSALMREAADALEMAAPDVQGEPVAMVDADDDGMWADILPNVSVKVGQILYAAPQAEQPGLQEKLKVAYWDFDARVKGIKPYSVPCGQPEHAFIVSVMAALEAPHPAGQQPAPDVAALAEALDDIAKLPIDPCSTENDCRLSAAKAIANADLAAHRKGGDA